MSKRNITLLLLIAIIAGTAITGAVGVPNQQQQQEAARRAAAAAKAAEVLRARQLPGFRRILDSSDVPVSTDSKSCPAAVLNQNAIDTIETVVPGVNTKEYTKLAAEHIDIAALSPAAQAPGCFYRREGWWSYELCFGRWLRQFHEEAGVIESEYILGWGPELNDGNVHTDWLLDIPLRYKSGVQTLRQKLPVNVPMKRFGDTFQCTRNLDRLLVDPNERAAASKYNHGTQCDLTKKPRKSSVVALCEPFDRQEQFKIAASLREQNRPSEPLRVLFNVTEVNPCEYVVFVYGPAVCDAMSTGKKTKGKDTPEEARRRRLRSASDGYYRGTPYQGEGSAKQQQPANPAETNTETKTARKEAPTPKVEEPTSTTTSPKGSGADDTEGKIKPTRYRRGGNKDQAAEGAQKKKSGTVTAGDEDDVVENTASSLNAKLRRAAAEFLELDEIPQDGPDSPIAKAKAAMNELPAEVDWESTLKFDVGGNDRAKAL